MRRIVVALALTALAAAALAGTAVAKPGHPNVELGSTPAGLGPGDPWNLGIQVMAGKQALERAKPPEITIMNNATGQKRTYRAASLNGSVGVFVATIRFPSEGTWYYTVKDGVTGRVYEYEPVVIQAETPAQPVGDDNSSQPVASAAGDDDFPLWPVVGGVLGALAAGIVLAQRRLRRWPDEPSSAPTPSRGR